jgi:hypothetical protein
MTKPLEGGQTDLALHLNHLLQRVEVLADDAPRLVGVGVVADYLGGNHESGDEKAVTAGSPSGRKPLL